MSETIDEKVLSQYQMVKRLGKGSYGIVWKATNKLTSETVAVKKCFDCFQNSTDSQRTFREISLLEQLNGHPNILRLYDVLQSQSGRDLYIVCEYMETDLSAVIKANMLEPIHVRYVTYQLLSAMKFMHSVNVVHRDIKPANILIDSDCRVKVCDFGLARILNKGCTNVLTGYVATRWYRAPELLLGGTQYGCPVDLWAMGVILAEMLVGKPMFPGTSTVDQLERIIQVTGWPAAENAPTESSSWQGLIARCNPRLAVHPLCESIPKASVDALDLIRQLLQFDPAERTTADQAIHHSLLCEFRTGDEVDCMQPVLMAVDDNVKLRPEEYQCVLYEELRRTKSERDAHFGSVMNGVLQDAQNVTRALNAGA